MKLSRTLGCGPWAVGCDGTIGEGWGWVLQASGCGRSVKGSKLESWMGWASGFGYDTSKRDLDDKAEPSFDFAVVVKLLVRKENVAKHKTYS
jgi:hypothetical protein